MVPFTLDLCMALFTQYVDAIAKNEMIMADIA